MSKITLEPNSSGAGTFSIISPDSNTNRTLTIPDSDGEFLLTDSNGDLSVDGNTFYVDSANNRVGVGTSSPNSALDVNGSLQVTNSITAGDEQNLALFYNTGLPEDYGLDTQDVSRKFALVSKQGSFHQAFAFADGSANNAILSVSSNAGSGDLVNRFKVLNTGSVIIAGSLSKGSGSFRIDHPLPEKSETHHLVHSFVESPLADNIYRGTATLTDGAAQVNIDTYVGMTEGTFSALNGNPQIFLQNESGFEPLKGRVVDNILHIQCRDETATDTISWMVVAERQDQHMLDTEWTDEFGRPVLEPEKNPEPDEEPESDGEVIE